MSASEKDIAEYKKEWSYWAAGTIVFGAIYLFLSFKSGDWGFSMVLMPPIIWAVVLLVLPLVTKSSRE